MSIPNKLREISIQRLRELKHIECYYDEIFDNYTIIQSYEVNYKKPYGYVIDTKNKEIIISPLERIMKINSGTIEIVNHVYNKRVFISLYI